MEPFKPPSVTLKIDKNALILIISGRLDAKGSAAIWNSASGLIRKWRSSAVYQKEHIGIDNPEFDSFVFDLTGINYFDTAGAAFIAHLKKLAEKYSNRKEIVIKGLKSEFLPLMKLGLDINSAPFAGTTSSFFSFIDKKGRQFSGFLSDLCLFITFTGEITWALASSLKQPLRIRWQDTFVVAEKTGVDALPIVSLISFIVGLVMAFQAAIPMKMFGAEIYVANLIGIAMVRELGPLMTAIVLAGRSASAFAAEIGTMKINEEIDALTVMGFDPVKFLIVPRIIALTVTTPLLTVFANLMGILGGAVVILAFGYPFITYYNQIVGFVQWGDLIGGLVKCFVFGILIAATGCIKGYQTKQGPAAVGESTTQAVVLSIILIAVFDGIFSVVYYYLGI